MAELLDPRRRAALFPRRVGMVGKVKYLIEAVLPWDFFVPPSARDAFV